MWVHAEGYFRIKRNGSVVHYHSQHMGGKIPTIPAPSFHTKVGMLIKILLFLVLVFVVIIVMPVALIPVFLLASNILKK